MKYKERKILGPDDIAIKFCHSFMKKRISILYNCVLLPVFQKHCAGGPQQCNKTRKKINKKSISIRMNEVKLL
jgi:hypothetical protein